MGGEMMPVTHDVTLRSSLDEKPALHHQHQLRVAELVQREDLSNRDVPCTWPRLFRLSAHERRLYRKLLKVQPQQ